MHGPTVSSLNRRGLLQHVTDRNVCVMSHARRRLQVVAHMSERGCVLPVKRPRSLVGCRHATQLDGPKSLNYSCVPPSNSHFAVVVTNSFVTLYKRYFVSLFSLTIPFHRKPIRTISGVFGIN